MTGFQIGLICAIVFLVGIVTGYGFGFDKGYSEGIGLFGAKLSEPEKATLPSASQAREDALRAKEREIQEAHDQFFKELYSHIKRSVLCGDFSYEVDEDVNHYLIRGKVNKKEIIDQLEPLGYKISFKPWDKENIARLSLISWEEK